MWKDKLNKKERKHLVESKIRTLYDLRAQKDFLAKCYEEAKKKHTEHPYVNTCFECRSIISKLQDAGVVF